MASIINLGCGIAEVHHQYAAIHSAMFGAASFRLAVAAMTGRIAKTYEEYLQTLQQLQTRLAGLAAQVPTADAGVSVHQADQLRGKLAEYTATLNNAITGLLGMCSQLLQDEISYRETPAGGQSAFNRDKVQYDRVLLQLEQLGRRLNQLFSSF